MNPSVTGTICTATPTRQVSLHGRRFFPVASLADQYRHLTLPERNYLTSWACGQPAFLTIKEAIS